MEINEKKENLPVDCITDFISRGWEDIGILKARIEGLQKEFKGTTKIIEILEEFLDAYLIAVGQMEEQLGKKIDIPKTESLKEELFELSEGPDSYQDDVLKAATEKPTQKNLDYDIEIEQNGNKLEIEVEPADADNNQTSTPTKLINQITKTNENDSDTAFEFYTDFDEPNELEDDTAEQIKNWKNQFIN